MCSRSTRYARGDVEAALAASAHVVSGTWTTQRIEHLFLEPEACLARPLPDGRLHVTSQGQGIFEDRRQIASVLGEPEERLFVELAPNGGAFGGKEDMTIQAQTALLARLTGRPVRIELSREESIRMHPKRHPLTMTYTVGCDAEGRLTAAKIDILGDSGAYASVGGKVLERAAGHACGPYRMPALEVEAIAAYTNNPPCGAMRGFGVNQTSFAIEGCLDLLAAKVGLDGWEMRWRNIVRVGDLTTTGQVLEKSVGAEKTLLAVKPAYDAARAQRARGRHRLRREELRARQRRDRIRQVPPGGRAGRRRRAPHRLHRDGAGAPDHPDPMRGRGHRPAGGRVPAPGQQPLRARLRPDHRLARHAARRARRRSTRREKLKADLDAGRTLSDLVGNASTPARCGSTTPPPRAS